MIGPSDPDRAPTVENGSRRARGGRPRSADADRAILAAAVEVITEAGLAGATIRAVAERAGVPRSTVYRRYSSVYDLLAGIVGGIEDAQPVPETGDLRADLLAALSVSVAGLSEPRQLRLSAELIAARSADREVAAVVARFWSRRRVVTTAMARRAVDRGELPAGVDGDLMMDLISGFVYMRLLVRGADLPAELMERAVDVVLRGLGHVPLHSDAKPGLLGP